MMDWKSLIRTNIPLVDMIMNTLLSVSGEDALPLPAAAAMQNVIEGTARELPDPTPMLRKLWNKKDSVIIVIGRRGSGKTSLSLRLAEWFGRPCYAVGIGQEALGNRGRALEPGELGMLPPESVLIIDDAGLFFGTRDYASDASQNLHDLLATVRHKQLVIIANTVNTAMIDRYLLDSDLLLIKPVSALHREAERRHVQKLLDKATTAINSLPESMKQRFVYAYSDVYDFEGLIEYSLPEGYNDRLSRNKA